MGESATRASCNTTPFCGVVRCTQRHDYWLYAAETSYTGGMSTCYTYPHTIENGAGERLAFVRRVRDPAGDRLGVENLGKPGSGPPMRVHNHQEEALTVRQGRLGYGRPGAPPRFAGPGEAVVFGPGEPHKFWNAGEEDLLGTGYIRPADNVEYFLTAIFESQRENGGAGRACSMRRS